MRITAIRHSIRNWGADKVFLNYLSYLVEQGHEVEYWTNRLMTCFPIHPKIAIKKIPFPGALGTVLFTGATKFRSDVVLVDLAVMAYLANLRNSPKVVYFAQDYDISYYRTTVLKSLVDFAYRKVLQEPRLKTLAVSHHLADQFRRYRPVNLTVLPNGIDLSLFRRDPHSPFLRQRVKNHVLILFARPDRRKGLDIAVQALQQLQDIYPPGQWEAWVVGPEHIQIAGIDLKNFGFLKTEEELRDILSAADIYLSTSRQEGFGLLQLQALACECAMVTTSAFSLVVDEVNGLVSPIEDSPGLARNLKRVMTEPGLMERLKTGGRLLAEKYDMRQSQRLFEEILLEFVQQKQTAAHL